MNLNEQLQQAYEAGRRQGLNEQPGAGMGPKQTMRKPKVAPPSDTNSPPLKLDPWDDGFPPLWPFGEPGDYIGEVRCMGEWCFTWNGKRWISRYNPSGRTPRHPPGPGGAGGGIYGGGGIG